MLIVDRAEEKRPFFQGIVQRTNEIPSDENGFNEIVKRYSAILLAGSIQVTKNRQTAEDIVQETFLRLWEKRGEIASGNLGGWLYKVASNLAYRHLKRESCKTRVYASLLIGVPKFHTDVEECLLQKEDKIVLDRACTRLPEKQQVVYQLSRGEGLTRHEIARQLNISPNTVKNHLGRAVQFIKEHIGSACLFFLFLLFNMIFFHHGSTKSGSSDLPNIRSLIDVDRGMKNRDQLFNSGSTSFVKYSSGSVQSMRTGFF